ncbi:MAG: histidine kinase [Firmicutes bacterium]|nr:histidine kinase [Bacillota bacterium]
MTKVLIVDDMAFIRFALKKLLETNGYEVVGEAKDGVEAVEKYAMLGPDIVTMDITMPNMTGIEALKAILAQNPKAKIIMVSAMGQESFVKEAIINGAKQFVLKPFNDEKVIETINKVVAL